MGTDDNREAGAKGSVVVATEGGAVAGPAGPVQEFRAIPFAVPPTGDRRWRPPEAPAGWAGVRDASRFGPDCPQTPWDSTRAPRLDEDCLHLTVWTPSCDPAAKLPVLVWFYGGSFLFGSASNPASDGAALAAQGAVVVAANYRVGLFGFLAHAGLTAESPAGSSGNYGLLDQIAALRWVRDNIAGFGGDPSLVTPFGVSAGSASLALLQISPLAEGLFSRLILQSPGAFRPLGSLADAEEAGAALGDDLAVLRRLDASEVLARAALLAPMVRGLTSPRLLRPIRDGWVVPRDDRAAFQAGAFHGVPTLVGGNADEGSRLTAAWPQSDVAAWRALLADNFAGHVAEAEALYPVATAADIPGRLAEAFGDTQFSFGARGIARAVARRQPQTYRYLFERRRPGQADGPHHGEDVPYVFGTFDAVAEHEDHSSGGGYDGYDEVDRALGAVMAEAWIRFAATGDPNGGALPQRWPAYDAAERYLVFGDDISVCSGHRQAQLDFLDRYFAAEPRSDK